MTSKIASAAALLQLLYGLMLLAVGFVGVWTARQELQTIFGLAPDSWTSDVQATFLNQYRFLKSMEFGAGLFCIVFRPSILQGGTAGAVFLAIVGAGVVARSFAWAVDGRPAALFVVFLVLELVVFITFAWHMRHAHGTSG